MAKGGRVGYANGTEMPNQPIRWSARILNWFWFRIYYPHHHTGNIFEATAAAAAQDPFRYITSATSSSYENSISTERLQKN